MASPAQIYQAIQPMMKTADPGDIRRSFENMVALFPDFAQGHNDLGVLLYQAGEKDAARQHYERAAQLAPDNIIYQKNLADFLYVELELIEDALKIYVKVLELKPDDIETLLVTGHICVATHQFDDAMTFYRRVLDIEPSHSTAREYLEKLNSRAETSMRVKNPEELYKEAQHLASENKSSAAVEKLKVLVAEFPNEALAHNDLGVLLYQDGQSEAAVVHYEKAYQLQPDNITFAKNLADFYFVAQGRVEAALQIYVDILAKAPEDVETLLMTGRICASLQRSDDALVFFERVLDIEPWNQDAADSIEQLQAALTEPADASVSTSSVTYDQAKEQAELGNIQEAIHILEKLVSDSPKDALFHNDLGVLYIQSGQPEKSLHHYERASQLAPENMTFKKNLADYYWVQMGKLEDALKAYVDILAAMPEDIETLVSLGNVCAALQRFDDARVFLDRVLEIEPWNAEASDKLSELDKLNRIAQTG